MICCPCRRYLRPPLRLLSLLLLWLWLLVPSSGWARQSVLLVLSHQSPAYLELAQALERHLPEQHWQLQTLPLAQYNPSSVQADLIVTVGTQAASQVLHPALKWPVLSVLIPRQSFLTLSSLHNLDSRRQQRLLSAIYLEQPLDRQLRLASLIAPGIEQLGVVLGPSSHNQQSRLASVIASMGWQPALVRLKRSDNPIELIEPLARSSDALLVVPDRAEFNRSIAKWTLLLSYRNRIPLIGFSRRYVEAGATAALFSSPLSIAEDTALWLERWRKSEGLRFPGADYPVHFDLQLNPQAAQKIGLSLPSVSAVRTALSEAAQP